MSIDELIRITMNFWYSHTAIAIGILVVLAILTAIKPKPVLKTIGMILAAIVAAYILVLLYDALFSGLTGKKDMIHTY